MTSQKSTEPPIPQMPQLTKKLRATLGHVALHARVSRTTVSFVMNDVLTKGISEETRQKVLKAAKELGYQPHAAARSLAAGNSGTIAIIMARSDHMNVDAFLPRMISAINRRSHAHGYKVLLEGADDLGTTPGAFMDLVRGKRVDGLIITTMRHFERPYVRQLAEQGFPVVLPGNGLESFHSRGLSNVDIGRAQTITKHLIDLGHQRIAHLGFASEEFEAVAMRRAGYERALDEAGIASDPALFATADFSAQSGYEAMQMLLARKVKFTALFSGNDTVAFGAMKALHEAGRLIPRDVALVGFDDIPLAAYANPPLTTLSMDPTTMGHEAVQMLMALINGEAYSRLVTPYDSQLIIRDSCGFTARKRLVAP